MKGTKVQSTLEWAREHGREFSYSAAFDNYEPTRNWTNGIGWEYDRVDADRESGIILDNPFGSFGFEGATKSIFLIDDGHTVRPFYVAGYHRGLVGRDGPHTILHPFPTNFHDDGTPKLRADDGRPVDHSSWMLGPRRAYHLKIVRKP